MSEHGTKPWKPTTRKKKRELKRRQRENLESAVIIRNGYWDERIQFAEGNCLYAYGSFARRLLKFAHGAEVKLP